MHEPKTCRCEAALGSSLLLVAVQPDLQDGRHVAYEGLWGWTRDIAQAKACQGPASLVSITNTEQGLALATRVR